MRIGVPTEIKANENRIAMVPGGVRDLVADGHELFVQSGGGIGSGIEDAEYVAAGATMVDDADELWAGVDMIVKVKEPLEPEYARCRPDLLLFTYFHFAADETLTNAMIASGAACFTYETLEDDEGRLPLLTPMSEVAGRLSVQVGAHCLEKQQGGRGVLLGGVPGVEPANVLILGGGVVGTEAAKMASGMGANVTIMDIDLERLRYLEDVMPDNINTVYSNRENIYTRVQYADLVIGAVLIEGAKAPTLVPRRYLKDMKPGAVIVDVAVDQGGCVETSKPTTHANPTYEIDGILHYGVANMPGAVARTSTYALTNATLPWVRKLAGMGAERAIREDKYLRSAVNVYAGKVNHPAVAEVFGLEYHEVTTLVGQPA